MSIARCVMRAAAAAALCVGALITTSGCWDDDCDPPCGAGYSCFYGVCLSTGYCALSDPFAEETPHCVQRNEDGSCAREVGICQEGFTCACTEVEADGSCGYRQCVAETRGD